MKEISNYNPMIYVCPDVHCRSFYKPLLQVKDKPIIFNGDFMCPYWWEGHSDEEGIENLKEIFNFARNNKNVILLAGNHCENYIWSPMSFMRTDREYYKELHKLYRDNIDLLRPIYKIKDTIFTHAGISSGWVNTMNNIFKQEGKDFQLTEENIIPYIENEWVLELQSDQAPNQNFMNTSLNSPIFCIGRSRGGDAPYGGPFWSDFNADYWYRPETNDKNWNIYQVFGHTQRELTGSIGFADGAACIDSRAIFEYNLDTHEIKPSEINDEKTKAKISKKDWKGGFIRFTDKLKEGESGSIWDNSF